MTITCLYTGWGLYFSIGTVILISIGLLTCKKQTGWVLAFFWYFLLFFPPAFALRTYIAWDPQYYWHQHVCFWTGLRFKALQGSRKKPYYGRRNLILSDHRNMTDAMIFNRLVHNQAAILARIEVAYVFPNYWIWSLVTRAIWFFKRGGRGGNLEPFFKWIDYKFSQKAATRNALLVFCEGHRNMTDKPLQCKRGMIRYAYERKTAAQVLIYFGHQPILNENGLEYNPNQICYYFIDQPFFPDDIGSQQEWYNMMNQRFQKVFLQSYAKYQKAKRERSEKKKKNKFD